jgi:hypothetical protein
MHTKETPETPGRAGTHVQERLRRLLGRIGETLKRLGSTSVGQWWLIWVSGPQQLGAGVEQVRQCGLFGYINFDPRHVLLGISNGECHANLRPRLIAHR